MTRYTIPRAHLRFFLQYVAPPNSETSVSYKQNNSGFFYANRLANGSLKILNHDDMEYYQPLFASTFSLRAGFQSITLIGGFDDYETDARIVGDTKCEYHGGVSCTNSPHAEEHGTHNNITNRPYKYALIPDTINATDAKNFWDDVVANGESATPLYPNGRPIVRGIPAYFNDFYHIRTPTY